MKEVCDPKRKPESASYVAKLVVNALADVMDLGCGKYQKADACVKEMPGVIHNFDRIANRQSRTLYPYTPVVPLARIIEKIDSGL